MCCRDVDKMLLFAYHMINAAANANALGALASHMRRRVHRRDRHGGLREALHHALILERRPRRERRTLPQPKRRSRHPTGTRFCKRSEQVRLPGLRLSTAGNIPSRNARAHVPPTPRGYTTLGHQESKLPSRPTHPRWSKASRRPSLEVPGSSPRRCVVGRLPRYGMRTSAQTLARTPLPCRPSLVREDRRRSPPNQSEAS